MANTVLTPQEVQSFLSSVGEDLASADGLMSQQPLQAIWVASADCTPVLIGDVKTGQGGSITRRLAGDCKKDCPLSDH